LSLAPQVAFETLYPSGTSLLLLPPPLQAESTSATDATRTDDGVFLMA
jgi:hypothetical protein